MEIITGIISLVALIIFFVMAAALANISSALKNINRVLSAWSQETGIGLVTRCKKCGKAFKGKPAVCPYCGDKKEYIDPVSGVFDAKEEDLTEQEKEIVAKLRMRGIGVGEKIIIHTALRNILKVSSRDWNSYGENKKDWRILIQ